MNFIGECCYNSQKTMTTDWKRSDSAFGQTRPLDVFQSSIKQQSISYRQTQYGFASPHEVGPGHGNVITTQSAPVYVTEVDQLPSLVVPAIFVCIFCFCPTGIFAITQARNADHAIDEGDMETAKVHHKRAFHFILASIICGITIALSVVIARVILAIHLYK